MFRLVSPAEISAAVRLTLNFESVTLYSKHQSKRSRFVELSSAGLFLKQRRQDKSQLLYGFVKFVNQLEHGFFSSSGLFMCTAALSTVSVYQLCKPCSGKYSLFCVAFVMNISTSKRQPLQATNLRITKCSKRNSKAFDVNT